MCLYEASFYFKQRLISNNLLRESNIHRKKEFIFKNTNNINRESIVKWPYRFRMPRDEIK